MPNSLAFNSLSHSAMLLGCSRSMFLLGLIYLQGCDVEAYPEEAKYWLNKAKQTSPEIYTENIDDLISWNIKLSVNN